MLKLEDDSSLKIENDDFFSELETIDQNFVVEAAGKEHIVLNLTLSNELQQEGLSRELIHFIQNMRKEANLEVSDQIEISYFTQEARIQEMLKSFELLILSETLAKKMTSSGNSLESAKVLLLEAPNGYKGEIELAISRFSF